MRLSLWLVLILAFSVGMGCALVLRSVFFDPPAVVELVSEPTTKILVATRAIPGGIEITADFVAFQDVPLSEVPLGALSSFAQVYRRQPAYPIPAGCPICEDLLLPYEEAATQATFIPTGREFVTLAITQVRQGDRVFPPKEPLSSVLSTDQRVDIRLVPRNEAQGRLAKMKNEVLRTFTTQDIRNVGELILEGVPIHQVQRRFVADSAGTAKDSLLLLLDRNEVARLSAAAKRGQIRIFVCQEEMTVPESVEAESIVEVAEQPQDDPMDDPLDIALTLVQPLSIPVETAPAISMEKVQRDAPMPTDIVNNTIVDDAVLSSAPIPVSAPDFVSDTPQPSTVKIAQNLDRIDLPSENQAVSSVFPGLDGEEKVSIRNDIPPVSFGMSSQAHFSERPMEQRLAPMRVLPTSEPGQEAATRPYLETIMGSPRINQSIQFLPPVSVSSDRQEKNLLASVHRLESTGTSPAFSSVPSVPTALSVLSVPPPAPMPSATSSVVTASPTLQILPEKTEMHAYSPFERRVFTVQPSGGGDANPDGEIPTPPRLLRNSDAEMQME